MTESTDRKYLEMRERQARDWLLLGMEPSDSEL